MAPSNPYDPPLVRQAASSRISPRWVGRVGLGCSCISFAGLIVAMAVRNFTVYCVAAGFTCLAIPGAIISLYGVRTAASRIHWFGLALGIFVSLYMATTLLPIIRHFRQS